MRIPAAPPTALAAPPTAQPALLLPARAHTALPRLVLLPPEPTAPRQPAHPRLALLLPGPTELARMVHPRLALPLPAPTEPRQPALPLPAPTEPRQPALPRPAQVRMALPRLALLPPVRPRPARARMALPLLALLPPVHPQLAPTVLAHPVRLLPPELPRAARMVRLLATVPLAAPPLRPCAMRLWGIASLRVNPFRRRSPLIPTSRLPAQAAISTRPRTRPTRTVAVTRRTWIIWMSSPAIRTRFPTVSTVRSKPQVGLAAAAPTEPRRLPRSVLMLLLQLAGSLRGSLMILTVLALIVP